MKVEKRLKRLQKREEERSKRAYEREKEMERRNVFNFLNNTLGDKVDVDTEQSKRAPTVDVKQSSSKDLNIEKFKLDEDSKRIECEIIKLNGSLARYPSQSNGYRSISIQIAEKKRELDLLRKKEKEITKEQNQRKDKQKMTVF